MKKRSVPLVLMLLVMTAQAEDQSAALTTSDQPTAVQSNGKIPAKKSATRTLVWPDGTRYVGGVIEGKRSGKGTIFWQDGTRFVGIFENDMRNGAGTMILPDGTVYTGFFKDDELVDSPGASAMTAAGTDKPDMTPKKTEPASSAAGERIAAASPGQKGPAPTKTETAETSLNKTESAKAVPTSPVQATPDQSVKKQFSQQVTTLTDEIKNQLIDTIDLWGAAWSDKNIPQYLSNYAEDFKVPGKQSRRSWEGLRRARLNRPRSIDVGIVYEKFELVEPDLVDVFFQQTYRSDVYRDVTKKVLRMRKQGQEWKIMAERSR